MLSAQNDAHSMLASVRLGLGKAVAQLSAVDRPHELSADIVGWAQLMLTTLLVTLSVVLTV